MRRLAALLFATSLAAPAFAQTGVSAPIAALQQALAANEQAGGTFASRAAALGPVVDRAFDLQAILQAAVGLSYASIPPDKKAQLLEVFRQFTVASYVSNFTGTGDRFTISPQTRQAGADTVVQTEITPSSGSPTRVDYVMRNGPQGPKVVDVLLDGTISRVAVERSDFRSVISSGGADALMSSLSKKVTTLSNGQLKP
jgi:phospholipid transport system substrate-binding protein